MPVSFRNIEGFCSTIVVEAKQHLSDGLDFGDGLWAFSVVTRTMAYINALKAQGFDLSSSEKKRLYMEAVDYYQEKLPVSYRMLRSDAADAAAEAIYEIAKFFFPRVVA